MFAKILANYDGAVYYDKVTADTVGVYSNAQTSGTLCATQPIDVSGTSHLTVESDTTSLSARKIYGSDGSVIFGWYDEIFPLTMDFSSWPGVGAVKWIEFTIKYTTGTYLRLIDTENDNAVLFEWRRSS